MSDNDQKPAKVIRTSSGSTRFSAGGSGSPDAKDRSAASGGSGSGGSGSSGSAGTAATTLTKPKNPPRAGSGTQRTAGSASGSGPAGTAAAGAPSNRGGQTGKTGGAGNVMDGAGTTVRASSGGVKMGANAKKGPRTVKLTVAKLDPWSVMKMSFLLSVAIGIATVVAFLVLWLVLQATGTLQGLQTTLSEIAGTEGAEQLLGLFSLGRVLSFSIILALVNIVLMTALSTLFAFLYNIGASIVGGFHLTLTDD